MLFGAVEADGVARAIDIANARVVGDAPPAADADSQAVRAPLDILVAEDNRTNQLVVRKILENAGHTATIVSNGQQALESLNEKSFDLALMDINMPVLNGVDATKLYQHSGPRQGRTPIVALTADATPDMEKRCLEAGMIACITKPVEARRVTAWIDAFARDRARPTEEQGAAPSMAAGDQPRASTPIDANALSDLKSLGGEAFVSEIIDQFLADAANVLRGLHEAVATGDVREFRDQAHALRSCAANVGAVRVYNLCLDTRAIDARELALEGELRIRRIEAESSAPATRSPASSDRKALADRPPPYRADGGNGRLDCSFQRAQALLSAISLTLVAASASRSVRNVTGPIDCALSCNSASPTA